MALRLTPQLIAWFTAEKERLPLGAVVRANDLMHQKLGPTRMRLPTDGVVCFHDDKTLRVHVQWEHPLYANMNQPPLEPLPPQYLDLAQGG